MGAETQGLAEESEGAVCRCGDIPMETPQRNQISTPISKFEESPLFTFINSLSPIKPVKSINITQTFNSLSFASLPSIFTSPHVSSLKESRFLGRYQFSDLSKLEFHSENGNKEDKNEGNEVAQKLTVNQENFDPGSFVVESSMEPSYENSEVAIELSQSLSYDCVNPNSRSKSCQVSETKSILELAGTSASLVPVVQDVSGKSLQGEMNVVGMNQIDPNKRVASCDWESLISDAADILILDSSNDTEVFKASCQHPVDPGIMFQLSLVNKTQVDGAFGLDKQHEAENPFTQPGDGNDTREIAEAWEVIAISSPSNCVAEETSERMDDEGVSNMYRGTRRRCLIFDNAGACKMHLNESSSYVQSDRSIAANDKQLVSVRPGNDSPQCILPGIGLHLNALATTLKDNNVVNHESLVSGRESAPDSSVYFHALTTAQELSNKSAAAISSERNLGPVDNGVLVVEDDFQSSGPIVKDEPNQSSPKKKRRRFENAGENEACKRCNCKKSKCLKLYCECFAAGLYCVEPCSCQDCFNKPKHEDVVLATRKQIESRNPLAFAPKVIRGSDPLPDIGDETSKTPASARHKRGCNCKKSGCLKKYCECYQEGVGCSINCRCDGCKNAFGRKDGSSLEEEEIETCDKSVADTSLQRTVVQNIESAAPTTPLWLGRHLGQQPFSSKGKPSLSFISTTSSSGLCPPNQRFGKQNITQPQPQPNFDKTLQTMHEDEMPEILKGNGSPTSGIKSASPNSKRVSPPHHESGLSPGRWSSRKLILQSIPSFPSLATKF